VKTRVRDQAQPLAHPCPCCGGRTFVIANEDSLALLQRSDRMPVAQKPEIRRRPDRTATEKAPEPLGRRVGVRLEKRGARHSGQDTSRSVGTTIMTSDLLTNPQYWRDRAEEIRVLAERSVDTEIKRVLETIVADHELLARRAEERLCGGGPNNCD
jgi:hypothetical protein